MCIPTVCLYEDIFMPDETLPYIFVVVKEENVLAQESLYNI